ncbi:hypothetical protein EDC96DRAFT_566996 [Choanephora cucurbitarum]|nr:hypothetical protein EDC96DRAFT_566996 [Choanephora cucurbitarum]
MTRCLIAKYTLQIESKIAVERLLCLIWFFAVMIALIEDERIFVSKMLLLTKLQVDQDIVPSFVLHQIRLRFSLTRLFELLLNKIRTETFNLKTPLSADFSLSGKHI